MTFRHGSGKAKGIMKALLFLMAGFFLSCPVQAHFTHGVVSHIMLSYLYDQALVPELDKLQSHYEKHIQEFSIEETQRINTWLTEEQAKLNTPPPALEEIRQSLNQGIQAYNSLFEQWEDNKRLKRQLRESLQAETKTALEENERQIKEIMAWINTLVATVNQRAEQLTALEATEKKSRLFYLNQDYMSEEPLKTQKAEMEQWKNRQDQKLNTEIRIYNQAVTDFETTQTTNNIFITEQKQEIARQEQALEQQESEINEQVAEYNRVREEECQTKECIEKLTEEKTLIAQKREKYAGELVSFNTFVSTFNQYIRDYKKTQNEGATLLRQQRQGLEQLKEDIFGEWDQKQQQWEATRQEHQATARTTWEKDKQELSQFQSQLTADYGEDFRLFTDQFALWSKTLQAEQQKTPQNSSGQAMQEALCAYSQQNPSALSAQNLCENITRRSTLQKEFGVLETDGVPTETRKALNKITEETAKLVKQMEQQFNQNEEKTADLNRMVAQYNNGRPLRQQRYENLKKEMAQKKDTALAFISIAYKLRASLLNKEYDLLHVGTSTASSPEEQESLNTFRTSWADFMSVMSGPLTNVRGFPEGWTEPFHLVRVILAQAQKSLWPTDQYAFGTKTTNLPVHFESEGGQRMEEEEKRELILTWMQTPFISAFLKAFSEKMAWVLAENTGSVSQGQSANPSFEESVALESSVFVGFLFLESMYHRGVFQKGEGSQPAHFVFNDLVLWFQPDGKLERPRGIY